MIVDKKIVFIHHGRVMGGAPRSLKNTILGLEKNGCSNIKVLFAYDEMKQFISSGTNVSIGDIYSPLLIIGRLLVGLSSVTNFKALLLASIELFLLPKILLSQYNVLSKERPDILHLNSSILFLPAIVARFLKIPIVWHVREVVIGSKYNLRRMVVGWFIRKMADKVICISEVEAKHLGADTYSNVSVVYNFIDFKDFDAGKYNLLEERRKYGVDESGSVVVSLGGVSFRKGTVEIIKAAQLLPDITFLVAGQFPKLSEITTIRRIIIARVHHIEDVLINLKLKSLYSWYYAERVAFLYGSNSNKNLTFTGVLDDVVPLLAICDILIFAGCTPHFPRPIYEAWIMNKPVVAFRIEGVNETVEHNCNGLIVDSNASESLAASVSTIIQNSEKAEAFGIAGKSKSVDRFDMNKNIQNIISIYKAIGSS